MRQMTDMADICRFGAGQKRRIRISYREGEQQKVQVALGPRPAVERLTRSTPRRCRCPLGEALPERRAARARRSTIHAASRRSRGPSSGT